MKSKRNYQAEADHLARAIDLAIESFENHCPPGFEKRHLDQMISCYKEWKEQCINPEPRHRNLSQLKYTNQNVFTYFQEGTGETVNYFWNRIGETGLPYTRENKLKKIMERGKIKGVVEFEYVTDLIVVAEQEGLTTPEETVKLNQMLGDFESKKRNKTGYKNSTK